jgi:hypothetical protein
MVLKKNRYDYFLIWGHGVQFQDEIQCIIEAVPEFEVIKVFNYITENIHHLVRQIYSYDYAPFHHLKSKTEYLKKTLPKVRFIFIKNYYPIENNYGEERFQHIECERVKRTKEVIRNQFNEKKNNRRTEDHVVHASDNELQTDHILKYLGYKQGVKTFDRNQKKIIKAPFHLKIPNCYSIEKIRIESLLCSIVENNKIIICPMDESPQFKGGSIYKVYLQKNNGVFLQDGYSINKFELLKTRLDYLKTGYSTNYIITQKYYNNYLILDGLHRATIQKKNGNKYIKVVII